MSRVLTSPVTSTIVVGTSRVDRLIDRLSRGLSASWKRRILGRFKGSFGNRLGHRFARADFERYMRQKIGRFYVHVDPGPLATEALIMKTFVLNESDKATKLDPHFYFRSGYTQTLWWLKMLEQHGFNLRTTSAIMELGTGSARLIRHLRCIDGIRLVGSDLNAENIEWCRENIHGIEFHGNEPTPPLKFAEDGAFDMVFAASVFTHIPLDTQGLWIAEMNRILKPGGFFVCNVLGRFQQDHMLDVHDLEVLHTEGHLTLTDKDEKASLSTKVIGSWDVFQTRREVLRAFGRHFTVLDYSPAVIDVLVLRKPYGN